MVQEVHVGASDEEAVDDVREALAAKYGTYRAWGQDRILPESQSSDREFDELRRGRSVLAGRRPAGTGSRSWSRPLGPTHILLRSQWPGLPQERVMASLHRLTDEVLPALAGVAA
jgi:hypothetical protein